MKTSRINRNSPCASSAARRTATLALLGLFSLGFAASGTASVVFTTLHSFNHTNGAVPEATLAPGGDGAFYGTTIGGGTNGTSYGGDGTVFRISTNGEFKTLAFLDRRYASNPQAGLCRASDGYFYGTTGFGGERDWGVAFRISSQGEFSVLAPFEWPVAEYPNGLTEGTSGILYGTAYYGGTNGGHGSVFQISSIGDVTLLFGMNGTNGAHPQAPLLLAGDGNFYGTTVDGGTNGGYGTLFRITPGGEFTSLISFNGTNGAHPMSALVQDAEGDLYGTTSAGGLGFANSPHTGNGTVFKFSPPGELTTLHFFKGYPEDGSHPSFGGLSLGPDGNYYGTTEGGGAYGSGAIFALTTNGIARLAYSFSQPDNQIGTNSDGWAPSAGLALAGDGNFYGVTMRGGGDNVGTIFRLGLVPDPPVITVQRLDHNTLRLAWSAIIGRKYQVQRSTNLTGWWEEQPPVKALSETVAVTNSPGTSPHSFFRVVLLP